MKKIKKWITVLLSAMFTLSALPLSACGNDTDFTVGICQLVQHEALDAATQGFVDSLQEEMDKAGKTITFDNQNAQGESSLCSTIVNKFVSKQVDLIMANATPALQAAVSATKDIPILGTSITEYGVALNIPNFSKTVGGNVSGTSDLAPLDEQANMLVELLPSASTIGIVYCSGEANSKYQADAVKTALEGNGKTVTVSTFTDSNDISSVVTGIVNNIVNSVDALYIPTDNTAASNASIIHNICAEHDIPVFAGEENLCKNCGFATLSISYYNIGVKTGKMAAEILLSGKDISTMPISYDQAPVKKYNESICQELGIDVSDLIAKGYTKIEG